MSITNEQVAEEQREALETALTFFGISPTALSQYADLAEAKYREIATMVESWNLIPSLANQFLHQATVAKGVSDFDESRRYYYK